MGRHPRCTGGGVNEKYQEFLRAKARLAPALGFDIRDDEINPILKPHQRDIVRWAVKGGRRAIFAAFGLGKSMMQIEAIRLVLSHGGGRGLIIAPLGVRQEFRRDGAKLGVDIKFVRHVDECEATGIYITNYETVRDGKLDPNEFAGTECAVTRNRKRGGTAGPLRTRSRRRCAPREAGAECRNLER